MLNFRLLRHLTLFLAVAEERHFGRAAKRLGMSQPPLSEQIQVLEQSLKVQLFDRSHRSVQLTAAGAAILPAVRKFVEQMGRVELAVREAVAGRHGVLTIGAIQSAMVDPLPGVIRELEQQLPAVTISVVEIDSGDAVRALELGDIDVALARLDGDLGPTVRTRALITDRVCVALPRDHALAKSASVSLASLAGEPFVMCPRAITPTYFDRLMSACNAHGFSPRILHEARSVTSQIALVGCGQGIALVPSQVDPGADKTVVLRPLNEFVEVVTLGIAWNLARESPVVKQVVALAVEVLTRVAVPHATPAASALPPLQAVGKRPTRRARPAAVAA
jgi:DNA-binding transcriptional LysR family regulator